MKEAPGVLGAKLEVGLGGAEQPGDLPVFDHDAFGLAGGAGGVDDVGQLFGAVLALVGVVAGLGLELGLCLGLVQHEGGQFGAEAVLS